VLVTDAIRTTVTAVGVSVREGFAFHQWFMACDRGRRDSSATGAVEYARFAKVMLDQSVRLIPGGRWYVTAAHSAPYAARMPEAAQEAFRDAAVSAPY
jgi:hypothetical protein